MKPRPSLVAFFSVLLLLASTGPARAAAGRLVTGADASAGGPHVKAFTTRTQTAAGSYFAYPPGFAGGVRVAAGDVNGDGAPDIVTGSGPGAGHVKVFAGGAWSQVRSFLPYGSGFSGGVFVATGDLDGDGHADIVTGVDEGAAAHVKVFSGATGTEIRSFFAYPVEFTGGVRVATGDINGDGLADIITGAGPGGLPQVRVLDGVTLAQRASFLAYPETFLDGVFVGVAAQFHPRLETAFDRVKEATLLQWPAGCLCEVEGNPKLGEREGWEPLRLDPVQNGDRFEVPLPTDLGTIFFRLNCDDEALPQAPAGRGLVNRKSTF